MRKIIIILVIIFTKSLAYSQVVEINDSLKNKIKLKEEGWTTKGSLAINLAQTSLSNWSAGGQNSFAVNGLANFSANYKKGKSSWVNNLDLGYGIIRQGKGDNILNQKSDDKIDLASKYGRKINNKMYYAALFSFKTQMTEGYNYPNDSVVISNLFAPAYLVTAIGIDYKPNDKFSAFIAPLTSKLTVVNDQTLADAGSYGVEPAVLDGVGNIITPGKNMRSEIGGYMKFAYQDDIMKNVTLTTKLDLFSNYIDNPQNIDINWELLLSMKINKYLSASINTLLIYDHDTKISVDNNDDGIQDAVGPRVQFKELLGIGFSVKF